jgi:hypothetical protein
MASTEPCTSALTTTGYSMTLALSAGCREHRIEAGGCQRGALFGRLSWRYWATSRARCSFSTTVSWSPAIGTPPRPSTSTGIEGPASLTCLPLSSTMARTRPLCVPTTKIVAAPQRAAIDQHRGNRPAALVELGLDHGRLGLAVGIGLEFEQFGLKHDLLDQRIEPLPVLAETSTSCTSPDIASTTIFVFEQALAHLLRVGSRACRTC